MMCFNVSALNIYITVNCFRRVISQQIVFILCHAHKLFFLVLSMEYFDCYSQYDPNKNNCNRLYTQGHLSYCYRFIPQMYKY